MPQLGHISNDGPAAPHGSKSNSLSHAGQLCFIFCRSITDQPRRAGDIKFKKERVPGVGCNGWLGLCDVANEQRSNARVRSRGKLLTRALNQTASRTCGAIARARRERSNAGKDIGCACAPSFFFAPKTKNARGKLYSFLVRESTTRSFTSRLLVFPTLKLSHALASVHSALCATAKG